MASHSSIPAWKIPWTDESGGLQSMESQRVGTQLSTHVHARLAQKPNQAFGLIELSWVLEKKNKNFFKATVSFPVPSFKDKQSKAFNWESK